MDITKIACTIFIIIIFLYSVTLYTEDYRKQIKEGTKKKEEHQAAIISSTFTFFHCILGITALWITS